MYYEPSLFGNVLEEFESTNNLDKKKKRKKNHFISQKNIFGALIQIF